MTTIAEALGRLKYYGDDYGPWVYTEPSHVTRERSVKLYEQAAVEQDYVVKLELLRRATQYRTIADLNQFREIHATAA